MEYAISISVVVLFVILFICTRERTREVFFKTYDECEYVQQGRQFIRNMPFPKEGGNKLNTKKYARAICHTLKKAKKAAMRYDNCNNSLLHKILDELYVTLNAERAQFLTLCKQNNDVLSQLPSVNGEPRAVALARFCLTHSDYILSDDRIRLLFNEQNKYRTLSVNEILSMQTAFEYVLLEKLYFLVEECKTFEKLIQLAMKYTKHSNTYTNSPIYKSLLKNRLFMECCAIYVKHNSADTVAQIRQNVERRISTITHINGSLHALKLYDFSRYYTPCEILDKYSAFTNATTDEKNNFLTLLKELSDKENMDEFMYTVRLDKYMQTAMARHGSRFVFSLFDNRVCLLSRKSDISLLAAALLSGELMNMYFSNNKMQGKNKQTIMINGILENSFEPIYRYNTINFGISTANSHLRISKTMPPQIVNAKIVFEHNGVNHSLFLERGTEEKIFLGDTLLHGVSDIVLGQKSLDIHVTILKK